VTRRTLTPDVIVQRAIKLADEEGLDAVSMRKLSQLLKVTPMALYNHVGSKEVLLNLMVDQIVAGFYRPEAKKPWQSGIEQRAVSMRSAFLAHTWVPGVLTSQINLSEAMMRDMDAVAGCFAANGFSHEHADWAKNAIDSFVYGFVLHELNFPIEPETYQETAAQFLPLIDPDQYPNMHSAATAVVDGTYDGIIPFEYGLEILISGIAAAQKRRT